MDLNDLRVDSTAEQEGVWEDFGGGTRVLIARLGNPAYSKKMAELLKPHKRSIRAGTMSEADREKVLIQAIAGTVLLNWEGMKEDGKVVKYSSEEAVRLLTQYQAFRDMVVEAATDAQLFKKQEREAAVKN